jgi:alpha-L-rhamnosidase
MVNSSYYYINSLLLSRIATVLGKESDAIAYSSLADTIKGEINKTFLNLSTYNYATDYTYQTYQILALATGIAPDDVRNEVLKTVIDDITVTRKGHLNTGIIGTKYMWPVLAHAGKSDLAYSVVKQTTYPSFGYWIEKGSTTLLEQWDGKNSHNHQMFGSVDEFFFKYLAGIRSPEDGSTSKGYRDIHIQPYIPQDLESVNASINTVAGKVVSDWKQKNGTLTLKVEIPANSTATISIPAGSTGISVSESGNIVWEGNKFVPGTDGISEGNFDGRFLNLKTGSGKYEFTVKGSAANIAMH